MLAIAGSPRCARRASIEFMRKLLAWMGYHPITLVFVLLGFLGIGGLWLSNWHAERHWQRYCDAARARGVKLTLAEFIPPEVPDSENFAALPMFRALHFKTQDRPLSELWTTAFSSTPQSPMSLLAGKGSLPDLGDPMRGRRMDWKEWQRYFQRAGFITQMSDSAARDVLAALERYAPLINEWSQWRTRPRARFPVDYKAGTTIIEPHRRFLQDAGRIFALRMRAHLALGDSAAAYGDFRDGLQGYLALKDEPTLVSGLTRISVLSGLVAALGDGLAERRWAQPELRKVEADLMKIRIGDDYRLAFSSERGFANANLDELASASPWRRKEMFSKFTGQIPQTWIITLIPRCCFRDNQLRMNRHLDELLAQVSADGSAFDPDAPNPSGPEHITGTLEKYDLYLFRVGAAPLMEVGKRFFRMENRLRQARLACAAERFRLATGAFPETLAELVPAFIAEEPLDIYSGKPMIYRRKGSDSFLLYSVGPNRIDDHGVVDPHKPETQQLDDAWYFAPAAAP
jgi:hypothetical protein